VRPLQHEDALPEMPPRGHRTSSRTLRTRETLLSDADNHLAEMRARLHIVHRLDRFLEREHPVHHRLHFMRYDRPIHSLEHFPRADVNALKLNGLHQDGHRADLAPTTAQRPDHAT